MNNPKTRNFLSRYSVINIRQGDPYYYYYATPYSFSDRYLDNLRSLPESKLRPRRSETVEVTFDQEKFNNLLEDIELCYSDDYIYYKHACSKLGAFEISRLLGSQLNQKRLEEKIRETVPAVKKAWENYQMMLKLAGESDA